MFKKIEQQGYYLIAEIGVNYYDIAKEREISLMDAAKLMCYEAKAAGVDAVKFQTYKADKIASKYSPAYWDLREEPTTSQHELFMKFDQFGEMEYAELSRYCREIGVEFMSTPFDFEAADFLDRYMDYFKISSSDVTNIPFIEHIAKKDKPILISAGASEQGEIDSALAAIRRHNQKQIVLMHCVLEYPTPYEHANLNKIRQFEKMYPHLIIGYSDHTKPDENYNVLKSAYLLGARAIEKHFTLNKALQGNDHYHAMDQTDVAQIKKELDYCNLLCGSGAIHCLESEEKARLNARRSIVANRDLHVGDIITEECITFKRPGHGISPADSTQVIGKCVKKEIKEDTAISWDDLTL